MGNERMARAPNAPRVLRTLEFRKMPNRSGLATVAKDGRIVIPARFRKELGIRPGDKLVVQLQKSELRIYSGAEALRKLQNQVTRTVPRGVSLAQQLIEDRQRESARK